MIVLATVTSERPLFEPVYGTDLARTSTAAAVVPLYRSIEPATGQPVYGVSCTGAFVIEDGVVQPRNHGLEFKDDGVYSMTEQELVAAV